jgi:enoyl-CoA hydratase/carnithine racemase
MSRQGALKETGHAAARERAVVSQKGAGGAEQSTAPVVLRSDKGAIVNLQLNRPRELNCLSEEVLAALQREFSSIARDDHVKCVVISGAGRAFCAGHDLKEMQPKSSVDYYRGLFAMCSNIMRGINDARVPVIAKVHGDATAAGCQLVAACDIAIASTTARFAAAGINLGSFCATPAVAITRKIPANRAFEMLFTGRLLDAATAAEWGLINRAVSPDELDQTVDEIAATIASKSGEALRFGKSQFYRQREMNLSEAYEFASEGISNSLASAEAREGIDAFLCKRQAVWKT